MIITYYIRMTIDSYTSILIHLDLSRAQADVEISFWCFLLYSFEE